MTNQYQQSTTF